MNKIFFFSCFCVSFISLEISVFFGVIANNTNGYNGCVQYNCTYTLKKNSNKEDDCWVSPVEKVNDGCFLGNSHCPTNNTICWLAPGSFYNCLTPECQALDPKIILWLLCAFFAVLFVVSCGISVYQFNKIFNQLNLYQKLQTYN